MATLTETEKQRRKNKVVELGLNLEIILNTFHDNLPPVDTMQNAHDYFVGEMGLSNDAVEHHSQYLAVNPETARPRVDYLLGLGLEIKTATLGYGIPLERIKVREAFLRSEGVNSFKLSDFHYTDNQFIKVRKLNADKYLEFKENYK